MNKNTLDLKTKALLVQKFLSIENKLSEFNSYVIDFDYPIISFNLKKDNITKVIFGNKIVFRNFKEFNEFLIKENYEDEQGYRTEVEIFMHSMNSYNNFYSKVPLKLIYPERTIDIYFDEYVDDYAKTIIKNVDLFKNSSYNDIVLSITEYYLDKRHIHILVELPFKVIDLF